MARKDRRRRGFIVLITMNTIRITADMVTVTVTAIPVSLVEEFLLEDVMDGVLLRSTIRFTIHSFTRGFGK